MAVIGRATDLGKGRGHPRTFKVGKVPFQVELEAPDDLDRFYKNFILL